MSCSKKSDPAPSTPTLGCLVTKSTITFNDGSNSQTSEFKYDANGILTSYTLTSINPGSANVVKVYTYTYTSGVLSSVTEAIQGGSTTTAAWTNDASHRVTKIVTPTSPATEATFNYDSDGNFKNTVITQGSGSTTLAAQYANAQLTSFTVNSASPGFTLNSTYTYSSFDLKNNPWSLLATATGQKFFTNTITGNVNPEYVFKSNPGKDEYDQTFTSSSNHGSDTYTYEYNAKNYPTKITRLQAGSSSPLVTTFEYSNCN